MNHTGKCKLLVYMDDDPDSLHPDELADYIGLVEQLLQELRQRQVEHRTADAQQNPVRP